MKVYLIEYGPYHTGPLKLFSGTAVYKTKAEVIAILKSYGYKKDSAHMASPHLWLNDKVNMWAKIIDLQVDKN